MNDLERLLAAMDDGRNRGNTRPVHDAQIMELRALLDRYAAPIPFKVGDLVTPRKGSNVTGAGEPHIVLEVLEHPHRAWNGESGGGHFGRLITMRVGCLASDDETYVAFSVEHYSFEPYAAG